nr:T9SS type A sorting domain-containing protein [Ignavibacteria bacterium]
TVTQTNYSFNDNGLSTGTYKYRLKQIDFNGNFEYYNLNNEVNIGTPSGYALSQNYPNPFNPSTTINFDIPKDGNVSIKLFDISGKEVETIVNEVKTAGYYTINFNASSLPSGIYFYTLNADNYSAVKKMMLVK